MIIKNIRNNNPCNIAVVIISRYVVKNIVKYDRISLCPCLGEQKKKYNYVVHSLYHMSYKNVIVSHIFHWHLVTTL